MRVVVLDNLRRWGWDLAVLLVGVVVIAALLQKNHRFFHDDAFISLRYARNLAETGLAQWNPGEWVEGYTSFLHVALSGGLIQLGMAPTAAVFWLNALALLTLLLLSAKSTRTIAPEPEMRLARASAILAVAGSSSLAIWVLGGLEAVIAAAFLAAGLAAILTCLHRPCRSQLALASLAFSGAILTRLDASVFIVGAGVGFFLVMRGSPRQRLISAGTIVGVPAAVAFVQMAVRLQLYEEFFPLTFYAKTSLPFLERVSQGFRYVARALDDVPVVAFSLLVLPLALAAGRVRGATPLIFFPIAFHLTYVVWAGGDHMPAARMLVPLIVPAAWLVLSFSSELSRTAGASLVCAMAVATLTQGTFRPPQLKDPAAFVGEIVGHCIDETWPRGISVALNTAGSTPFYASDGRNFIDMLGLNDPVIAKRRDVPIITRGQNLPGHHKGDGAYVLSRSPNRIIVGPAEGTDVSSAWFLSGAELAQMPEFRRCYKKVVEEIPYSQKIAALGPPKPNPLIFTYYDRTCQ